MKVFSIVFALLIVVCSAQCSTFSCSRKSTRPVKTYVIDLDKPARERFKETSIDFKDKFGVLIEAQKYHYNRYLF